MTIKNCLILAAGFGTRMGEIGKHLPKVMWPIFEKRLIELQIDYASKLRCERIFVNTHYKHDLLGSFLSENYPHINILHEEKILDVGGAIHNLKRNIEHEENQSTLLLNGDVLYFFDEHVIERAIKEIDKKPITLFGVHIGPGYSQLKIENGNLKAILPKTTTSDCITYSGMALLDISKINMVPGPSKFFETVADYHNMKVRVVIPENGEYHDFGTAKKYVDECFGILDDLGNEQMRITKFCKECTTFSVAKLGAGYGSSSKVVINLSERELTSKYRSIVMKESFADQIQKEGIYFNQIIQPLDD